MQHIFEKARIICHDGSTHVLLLCHYDLVHIIRIMARLVADSYVFVLFMGGFGWIMLV
jgi:hypothetical protein